MQLTTFSLTPRELETLKHIVNGHTDSRIAGIMGVTSDTIHVYRKSLLRKLEANNVASLVRIALTSKLIYPGE